MNKTNMWTVDECPDAYGHWTIRIADGTPNGNTDEQPIATVYNLENAKQIVQEHNNLYAISISAALDGVVLHGVGVLEAINEAEAIGKATIVARKLYPGYSTHVVVTPTTNVIRDVYQAEKLS